LSGRRLGLVLLGLVGLAWVLAALSGYDPVADVHPALASAGPGAGHGLGTDHLGRDVLARLLLATHAFVGPGLLAALCSLLLGLPAGALAGALGGIPAAIVRFLSGAVASVPGFVWVLLVATIFGSAPAVLALAAGFAYAPALALEVSGRVEQLRRREFVLALRAHGHSEPAILLRHLLWNNARALVARHAVQVFAFYLAVETTLSYIGGFGVAEPQPSWGNMLSFSFGRDNPLAALAPALALWATSLGLSLLAGGLVEPRHEP